MPKEPLIFTFDCGTQSVRALVFNKKGATIAMKQIKLPPYISLHEEWFEQKPEVFYDLLCQAAKEVTSTHPEIIPDIIGVTITVFRDSMVNLDKDKKPLRPCIMWSDQRRAKLEVSPLTSFQKVVFKLVGMDECMHSLLQQGKSHWIRENEPEIWAKTDKYVFLSGYLIYRLTGKLIDSASAQIGHISYDNKKNEYYKKGALKYGIFGIEESKNCDIVMPGEMLGTITKEASQATGLPEGLQIIATGADKSCESLGTIGTASNLAAISFGTASCIQIMSKQYIEPETFLPCYPASIPNYWTPEVQLFRGCWMLTWFIEQFGQEEARIAKEKGVRTEEILNEKIKDIQPGCNGLVLQPFWAPALKIPEARGSIIGFTSSHTKYHLYRAILEGICFGLRAGLEHISRKQPVSGLVVSGGGSASEIICQITSDVFNLPVRRIQTSEACALGSSLIGFTTLKEFNSYEEAAESMIHYKDEFKPNKEIAVKYDAIYKEVYKPMYKQLKPLFKHLRDK